MSVTLAPPPFTQFFNPNNTGSPAVAYKVFTYQAGTSIKQNTYTDSTGGTPNPNPLQLNGNGYSTFWGDPTLSYKMVWAPSNDTDPPGSPLYTVDNFSFPATLGSFSSTTTIPILAAYVRTAAEISAGVTPVNYAYLPGDVRRQGVVGSGDETTRVQNALNVGGWVWVPPSILVTCNSNLTILGSTVFQIDGLVTMQTSRMIAYKPTGPVKIIGNGKIKSNSINTTDALPTGWNVMGIVNFGGISGSYASDFEFSCELQGDFVGTPGTITIGFNDRRRGIALNYVNNVEIHRSRISQTVAEGIVHFGDSGDANVHVHHNFIWGGNHDCISPANSNCFTSVYDNNIMWGALNGIESNIGQITDNLAYGMQGSGFGNGGNPTNNLPFVVKGNVGINNCQSGTPASYDFSFQQSAGTQGVVIIEDNESWQSGAGAFITNFCDTLIFRGNCAQAWGQLAAGVAFGSGNINTVICDDNHCSSEGAHSTGGFTMAALSRCIMGSDNTAVGVAVPWINVNVAGNKLEPCPDPVFGQGVVNSVTGTLVATTLAAATVKANTMGYVGGVEVICGGTITGVAGGKTINLQFGGSNFVQLVIAAATTGAWLVKGQIFNTNSASTQLYLGESVANGVATPNSGSLAINTANDQIVQSQVTLANVGDTITQNVFIVRPLNQMRQ